MTPTRCIGCAVLALTVGGCGGADLSDLERLVDNASEPAVAVTPKPMPHGESGFEYGAITERRPFEPFAEVAGAGASQAPDAARRPQPPELFPLGQLEMVGTLAEIGRASCRERL